MGWIKVCQGIQGKLLKGKERDGVGIDGYLKSNLDGIPGYLKKGYDCVGIISGMAKVRIGKCLKKGSKVLMSDGSWKLVEDIKIDDEVISPQLNGDITYEKVTNLHNRFEEDCYDIVEEHSNKILYSCAGNHDVPVYKINLMKNKYEYKIIEAKELSKFSLKSKNQFYCKAFNRNNVYIKCIKSSPSQVYGFSITGKSKLHITDNFLITHNSTLAIGTVGSYIAWLLAGGKVKCHQEIKDNKQVWVIDKVKMPTKKVNWNLEENICFSAEDLQDTAFKLYNKYGKGQVIVYDEGRQGLDSKRAMESINKGMEDFFQTCGFMGHVILIVLPNFFKLHEDYAVARSLFMINVYTDKNYNRGYFSFYNETQKERLYYFGKKRIGVRAKYTSASHNFWGKFSSWFPFDKDEYEKLKEQAMKKARIRKPNLKYFRQRNVCLYLLKKHAKLSSAEISKELSIISDCKISPRMIRHSIASITKEDVKKIK